MKPLDRLIDYIFYACLVILPTVIVIGFIKLLWLYLLLLFVLLELVMLQDLF